MTTSSLSNNRDSDSPGTKLLTLECTFFKLSDIFWSECFLYIKGLVSPTRRVATHVETTPPLAHPSDLAAQCIEFNLGSAGVYVTWPGPCSALFHSSPLNIGANFGYGKLEAFCHISVWGLADLTEKGGAELSVRNKLHFSCLRNSETCERFHHGKRRLCRFILRQLPVSLRIVVAATVLW